MFKFSVLKAAVNNFILCFFFWSSLFYYFFVLNKGEHSFIHGRLQFFCMEVATNNMMQFVCVLGVINT